MVYVWYMSYKYDIISHVIWYVIFHPYNVIGVVHLEYTPTTSTSTPKSTLNPSSTHNTQAEWQSLTLTAADGQKYESMDTVNAPSNVYEVMYGEKVLPQLLPSPPPVWKHVNVKQKHAAVHATAKTKTQSKTQPKPHMLSMISARPSPSCSLGLVKIYCFYSCRCPCSEDCVVCTRIFDIHHPFYILMVIMIVIIQSYCINNLRVWYHETAISYIIRYITCIAGQRCVC